MGLPTIEIIFKSLASSFIARSQKGIVLLILKDQTPTFTSATYNLFSEVNKEDWTPKNYDLIEKTFLGRPTKVMIEVQGADELLADVLKRVKSKKWNYLAIPEATETNNIALFIEEQREYHGKTFKAVLANTPADYEGVINFTADEIKVGEKTYSTAEYTCRIAGILAGLSFTRSSTYYVLPEVDSIKEVDDPNAAIDNGELILINDGEKIKIGRGVNSLKTLIGPVTNEKKSEELKKIKIIDGMDQIKEDITSTYENEYVGKYNNNYDNQVLFISDVNSYLKDIAGEILDNHYDNKADVNVEAQRLAWKSVGVDVTDLSDQQVKEKSFRSKVFLGGNVKFLDSMEDLEFVVTM